MGTSTPLGFPGGWDKGLGDLGLGQGVRGFGVRGAWGHGTMNIGWNIMNHDSGHGTLNIGWNIMMCGCKDTFRVSWGLGQGVRGLGVRGPRGTGP